MTTKLTLTIDGDVIREAKKFARSRNKSLSSLVENYLKTLTATSESPGITYTPVVRSLMGSFKLPADYNQEELLVRQLKKKYR